jgi:thiol-disulfide isomerase/thioredoxin
LLIKRSPTVENFEAFAIIDRLKAQKVSPVLKQKLIKLFTAYKGQNLYIDFWGDWCGPCMREMPNYPELISTLADKHIKFVFFSAFTTKESMLAIQKKHQINGDFINLSNDEVSILNNAFGFHSFPTHFMVNTEGMVIGKPNKGETAQKAKEIENILSK